MLRAARKKQPAPAMNSTPPIVPSVAMLIVSQSGPPQIRPCRTSAAAPFRTSDVGRLPRGVGHEKPDRVARHDLPAPDEESHQRQPAPPEQETPARGAVGPDLGCNA